MDLRFAFKNMDSSPALENHCRENIVARTEKISQNIIEIYITFSVEHEINILNCKLIDSHGKSFIVKEQGSNMYTCIDTVSHKLERILRKEKNKQITHKAFRSDIKEVEPEAASEEME